MKHIYLPPSDITRKLPFHLAMEEYVARQLPPDDAYFFMWRVNPTVIFGRNQIIDNEVNLEYCSENGIEYYRRKSGGGCVFADMSNIMFSYIEAGKDTVTTTFSRYTSMIAALLRSLGLDASDNSRNDILISGQKVSGNAFYHLPGRSIVHGTMLYDTDMAHMAAAITPSAAKLKAKGVESVRSRITTLSRHIDMTIEQFMEYTRTHLCSGEIHFTDNDVRAIEELSQPYYEKSWILGRHKHGALTRKKRIEGAGEFEATVELQSGCIKSVNLAGDFFLCADIDSMLLEKLRGVPYSAEAIRSTLVPLHPERIIPGLSAESLTEILI